MDETRKTIAFFTYNQVGVGNLNGWYTHKESGNRALVLQGMKNGAVNVLINNDPNIVYQQNQDLQGNIWKPLEAALPKLDRIVVYIGVTDHPQTIKLVASELPIDKVTLVFCSCRLQSKRRYIKELAPKALCLECGNDCGGIATMENLFREFFKVEEVPTTATARHDTGNDFCFANSSWS